MVCVVWKCDEGWLCFFFKQKTAYEMRISHWSSDVCSSDLLLPEDVYFEHLSNRRFPAGNCIRRADQLDYLQEPDVFHDVFGHVPLLANPVFADYKIGRASCRERVCQYV